MVKVGKRILTSLYLDPEQSEKLKALSSATRIPSAVFLREAVDDLLTKYDVRGGKSQSMTKLGIEARTKRAAKRKSAK